MRIKKIVIIEDEYGPNKGGFTAQIALTGGQSYPADINIGIPKEMLEPIVGIIQQAVAESMTRSAQEFAERVQASLSPPIEHAALADASTEA